VAVQGRRGEEAGGPQHRAGGRRARGSRPPRRHARRPGPPPALRRRPSRQAIGSGPAGRRGRRAGRMAGWPWPAAQRAARPWPAARLRLLPPAPGPPPPARAAIRRHRPRRASTRPSNRRNREGTGCGAPVRLLKDRGRGVEGGEVGFTAGGPCACTLPCVCERSRRARGSVGASSANALAPNTGPGKNRATTRGPHTPASGVSRTGPGAMFTQRGCQGRGRRGAEWDGGRARRRRR
jgi:hypothetical protein